MTAASRGSGLPAAAPIILSPSRQRRLFRFRHSREGGKQAMQNQFEPGPLSPYEDAYLPLLLIGSQQITCIDLHLAAIAEAHYNHSVQ